MSTKVFITGWYIIYKGIYTWSRILSERENQRGEMRQDKRDET